jgi:xanthine dehydrogenase YagT iron-sulfur-binding subunit
MSKISNSKDRREPGDEAPDGLELSRRSMLASSGGLMLGAALSSAADTADGATAAAGAQTALRLKVNGAVHNLMIDPRESLLDVLRERLDLTGTKKGCNQGACGACTVLVQGRRINSCLTLAILHNDAEVQTIEGLASANGPLHPLQSAFIEHEGFQCGFCTSGQIMSGVACIAEGHARSPDETRFWMSGNICRCGAYPGVVAAVTEVAGRKLS